MLSNVNVFRLFLKLGHYNCWYQQYQATPKEQTDGIVTPNEGRYCCDNMGRNQSGGGNWGLEGEFQTIQNYMTKFKNFKDLLFI